MADMSVFYVVFLDDSGEEESVFIQAPSERFARKAIGPRKILHVVPIEDGGFADMLGEDSDFLMGG